MDLYEVIRLRKSVRAYRSDSIPDDVLGRVLEAGRLAPSASNRQEWRYVVVRDAAMRAKLAEASNGQKFVAEAPVVLVACARTDGHKMTCGEPCYPIDVAISLDHITLRAAEEGLGTCWIGAFSQPAVKKLLGVPDDIRVVALMPLGYPAGEPAGRSRLGLQEIVMQEKWK